MTIQRIVYTCITVFLLACSGSSNIPNLTFDSGAAGCVKDTDCKNQRICQAGTCVDPNTHDSGIDVAVKDASQDSAEDVSEPQDVAVLLHDAPSFDAPILQQEASLDAATVTLPRAGLTAIQCGGDAGVQTCPGSATTTCCSGFCTDTALDPANCGACGNVCGAQQFCTGTSCADAVLSNVCDNVHGTIVTDPFDVDNAAGINVGNALTATCVPATGIMQLTQATLGVIDQTTGRPLTGAGNTFINGGGGYGAGQRAVAYLDKTGLSTLSVIFDGVNFEIRDRIINGAVVTVYPTLLTASHDFFYVQTVVEPYSSTLCFSVVGILGPGTQAGGYFVGNVLIPNRASYTGSWYVYEWTSANDAGTPGAGDTFKQIASSLTL